MLDNPPMTVSRKHHTAQLFYKKGINAEDLQEFTSAVFYADDFIASLTQKGIGPVFILNMSNGPEFTLVFQSKCLIS